MDDKLVRLSDVIETVENQCSDGNMWGNENLTLIDASKTIDELSDLPAVDAVEVVRCRECIHRKKYQDDEQQGDTICTLEWKMKKLDWYCADGQRREDGDGT